MKHSDLGINQELNWVLSCFFYNFYDIMLYERLYEDPEGYSVSQNDLYINPELNLLLILI